MLIKSADDVDDEDNVIFDNLTVIIEQLSTNITAGEASSNSSS